MATYYLQVKYNANGGSGAPAAGLASKTSDPPCTLKVTISSSVPTRTGYNFLGWGTSSSGSASYHGGDQYSYTWAYDDGTGTMTYVRNLYAIWEPKTWTIEYHAGTDGTGGNKYQTKTYGVALTLLGEIYTRTGYKQVGWATSDGGEQAYALSAKYTSNSGKKLYPVWEALNSTIASLTASVPIDNSTSGTLTITRNNSAYTHTVKYSFGSYSFTHTGVGTSDTFKIPTTWLNGLPSSTSGTATCTVTTYNGSTQVGSVVSKTFTVTVPASVVPVINSVTVSEAGDVPTSWGIFVQSLSKFKIATSASGVSGSTIYSVAVIANGETLSGTSVTTGYLKTSGSNSIKVTITDSRGRTATQTVTKTVLQYSQPDVTITSAERNSTTETTVDVSYSWTIISLSNKNAKTAKIEYKLSTASAWTQYGSTITFSAYSGSETISIPNLNSGQKYNIRITINDSFYSDDSIAEISTSNSWIFDYNPDTGALCVHGESTDTIDHWAKPIAFDETVDFVQRRCYASLSSAGWYRVLTYAATSVGGATGGHGLTVDFNIVRSTSAENHSITLRCVSSSNVSFVDESSKSYSNLIDKIRYTYDADTYKAHVDIHYTGSSDGRGVGVFFDAYLPTISLTKRVTSDNLTAVADAPSGETVLTTYTFAANGFVPNQSVITEFGDLSGTGERYAVNASSVSVADSTWTTVASITLPSAGVWVVYCTTRFASNATGYRRHILTNSDTGTSAIAIQQDDSNNAVSGTYTFTRSGFPHNLTSDNTTLYLRAYQTSGSALSTTGRLYAIRIC